MIWGGFSFLGESWLYEIDFWRKKNYIFIGFNKYSNDRSGNMVSPWKPGRFKVFQKLSYVVHFLDEIGFQKTPTDPKKKTYPKARPKIQI